MQSMNYSKTKARAQHVKIFELLQRRTEHTRHHTPRVPNPDILLLKTTSQPLLLVEFQFESGCPPPVRNLLRVTVPTIHAPPPPLISPTLLPPMNSTTPEPNQFPLAPSSRPNPLTPPRWTPPSPPWSRSSWTVSPSPPPPPPPG